MTAKGLRALPGKQAGRGDSFQLFSGSVLLSMVYGCILESALLHPAQQQHLLVSFESLRYFAHCSASARAMSLASVFKAI